MYRNRMISIVMIVPMTMFIGCTPSLQGMTSGLTNLSSENNATQDGENTSLLQGITSGITGFTKDLIPENNATGGEGTAVEGALAGAAIGGALVYLKTGDMKQAVGGALLTAAAGYLIGQKLAAIQQNYKGQEETLLQNIIDIDTESKELRSQNDELSASVEDIQNEISSLKGEKLLITKKKIAFSSELQEKRESLQNLLIKNQDLSSKIFNSKSQVNQYEYKPEDKQEILNNVNLLTSQAKKSTNSINKDIQSIDNMLASLA